MLLMALVAQADEPDKELARQRYKTGQALFQRGRAADALKEFEEGKRSFALPEFDYNIGLCLAKLDRPGEAADALESYMQAKPDDPDAAGIWRMIAELRAEAVRREKAEVARRQAEPSPTPMPQLVPPPPPPPIDYSLREKRATFTSAAIATVVIGGVMIVAALGTGGAALNRYDEYDSSCNRICKDDFYESSRRLAVATDVMIPIGTALVITSIVLFAKRPKLPPARAALGVSF
jgi:tetratricopeptide (TPR) repeat protein